MKLINGLRAERMQQMTTALAATAALDSVHARPDISARVSCVRAGKSLVFISRTDGQKCARIDRGGGGGHGGGGTVLCHYIKSPPGPRDSIG